MNSSSDGQKIATEDQDDEASIRGMVDESIRTLWMCNDHMRLGIPN
jgi:hypothetical protein